MNTHLGWGGGEKWHYEAACYFKSQGYEVTFICRPGSSLYQRLSEQNITCKFLTVSNLSFLNPFKIWRLNSTLKQDKVLFVNSPADNKLAGVASLFNRTLHIVFRRGMPHPIKPSLLNRWLFGSRISRVIANSETVKESLNQRKKNLVPEEIIEVIYNGFDLDGYQTKSFSPYFTEAQTAPVFVSCGRLVEQKNQLLLLEAAKYLKDKGERFKLIIAGDGPLFNRLNHYIEDHDLTEHCLLSGFLANVKDVLACADVFLFPSLYEGSSNALIEACGAGLPAIVSDIASNREIVSNDVNGFLLPIDAPEQWGEAMAKLMRDKEKLSTFGLHSKNKIASDFSLTKSREQLERLVDQLCATET